MLKVRKNKIYTALILAIMLITAFFALTPTLATSKVYAYDMDKRLSLQPEIVNNVVLFTFIDDANLVIDNGAYTARTYEFIDKFNERLNTASDSLQKYYHAMSNGKFKLTSNLVMNDNGTPNNTSDDTPFVVVLDAKKSDSYSTGSIVTEAEKNSIAYIFSELEKTSTTAILNGKEDCNGDGYVDIFTFICLDFATDDSINGQSYSTANTNLKNAYANNMCWPHRVGVSHTLFGFNVGAKTYSINQYLVMPSIQFTANTLSNSFNNYLKSTFFHEAGHGLGLPDMYVVDNHDLSYVGVFDIMATNYMQSMSAYSKHILGWTTAKEFKELTAEGTYTLHPSNLNEVNTKNGNPLNEFATLAYYITDPAYPNQKIVLEYRDLTNADSFDNNINGLKFQNDKDSIKSGLTIYRINENYNSTASLIVNSNRDNKASIFYFRNNRDVTDNSCIAFNVGDKFGQNEGTGNQSTATDINTTYIAFTRTTSTQTLYVNSNLCVEVLSMDSTGLTFKVSGGTLEKNPVDETMAKNILQDGKLLTALSEITGIAENDLTINDLEGVVELNLSNKGITDLTGLSNLYMPALKTLILNGNQIANGLEEISVFTSITNLQMADCGLTDISFIVPLANLAYVNFSANKITDFVCLNPKVKTKLIFANLVLNNLDTTLTNNNFILSGSYSNIFAIGIQNFPQQPTSITPKTIYYSSLGLPASLILTLANNSVICSLAEGENILGDGHYTLTYKFNDPAIAQEMNKTIIIDVIVVTLKQPIVELLVGDIYQNDSTASFDGWKSTYSYKATITFNNQTVEFVDTSIAGTYLIAFEITINANTSFMLYKKVIIYNDVRVEFGENGIKDKKLYIELLKLVGKQATIVNNEETVGTNADNTLYSQDLYFYDIDGKGEEITELNFANKKITDVTGICLLNLKKITVINLNQNSIINIAPLFEQGNEAMPNLQELHLAGLGITELPPAIGQMYSLRKLDLSFNRLARVDALKPLVIPALLETAGKQQMLQLVNLNMNNLSFSTSGAYVEDANGELHFEANENFAVHNNFIKDTTEVAGYKSGDQIFIIMIQNLPNYMSYINQPTFDYYNTRANTQTRKGKTEYIFIIKVNTLNVMEAWSNQSPKEYCKESSKYNITFSINGTNPLKLSVTNTQFKRSFFVSRVTLKNLKDINKKEFTLEDKWKYDEKKYNITSTERIAHPTQSDLNIITPIRNAVYHLECSAFYLESVQGEMRPHILNLNNDSSYNIKPYSYEITVAYTISIGGTEDGVAIKCHENAKIMYYVQIHINEAITIADANLDAKMREILKKKDGDKLYSYDTYNLTALNLSNSQISSINNISGGRDFTSFHFDNLLSLNLSKNKLEHINFNSIGFKKLSYLDLSYNNLCDATELKKINSGANPIYVLASNNLYTFNVDDLKYSQYAEGNMWLITAKGIYGNIAVIAGIQGINATNTSLITYSKEVPNAEGSTAGFYYIPTEIFDAKVFNATGATNDVKENIPYYHYNYYYYYKEAGAYTINFNFTFKNFSFNYQGTVTHGKTYVDTNDNVYIIDYDKQNKQETIQKALQYDILTYENCSAEDFTKSYAIFSGDDIIDESLITINTLTTYKQAIVIVHKFSQYSFYYYKNIKVLDREAPEISMDENSKFIQTEINKPYNWYAKGGIDRDISATDNCSEPQELIYKAVIYKEGEETPLSTEYVPLDKPGIYTIVFTATDQSGNVSKEIARKVRVYYAEYTIVKLTKPSAALHTGEAPFSVTVYRLEGRDPNPTFYWYVDGKFVKETKMDEESIDSKVAITSTVDLPFNTAGKHIVTVKINELESEDFVVVAQASEIEYFVLLDPWVTNLLTYIAIGIVVVAIITYIIINAVRKKKARKLADYEYNLISKK